MARDDPSGVTSQVTDILMTNASFYRQTPDDEKLYLIDLAVLGTLAYKIIEFAANVFGAVLPVAGGIRWAYVKYFPRETAADRPADASKEGPPPAVPPGELKGRLEQLKLDTEDPHVRGQLEDDVTNILEYHGWPTTEADADAKRIVAALVAHGGS